MHPEERVRWPLETARAVLDGTIEAGEAARSLAVQREQTVDLLRRDRDAVTRHECEALATRLRLLAEQVADAPPGATDREDRLAIAEVLGTFAAALR